MRKNLLIFLSLLLFSTSALAVERVSNYTANGEQVENTNLKSGLYVVRVVKDGNTMTKKVLVK